MDFLRIFLTAPFISWKKCIFAADMTSHASRQNSAPGRSSSNIDNTELMHYSKKNLSLLKSKLIALSKEGYTSTTKSKQRAICTTSVITDLGHSPTLFKITFIHQQTIDSYGMILISRILWTYMFSTAD